ncbi:MAG: hypothetical protein ACHQRM_13085 [Bacteroidia bacterium]
MNSALKIIFLFCITFLVSCMAHKAFSTIESSRYDEKSNLTTYTTFPLGSVQIPGKWVKTSFNKVSSQQNFRNADSVLTAVAINKSTAYPFYKPNMNSNTIVKEMYEWDSKYLADHTNGNRTLIEQDTLNHFIVWQITGMLNDFGVDNHYLFGSENGIVYTVFISTKKWTNEQKIDFVKTVYKNKTVGACCN